jgi:hypothetical protein
VTATESRGENVKLPMAVCAAVAEVLKGSHPTLDALFEAAGAPGPPPDLSHESKWKTWLFRAGNDPNVNSLAVVGNLIEEFMDLPPRNPSVREIVDEIGFDHDPIAEWEERRERLNQILEEHGFRYYRGGRVMPIGLAPAGTMQQADGSLADAEGTKPSTLEDLLPVLIRGLPRAMHPLAYRRKGAQTLSFATEYDIQDLLHSQLRSWVQDIRPEEFTPSYAGSATRMDFLLPRHKLVIETKRVRDRGHGQKIGDELIIDIEHYRKHPECNRLWCAIYDPNSFIPNPAALADLEGSRSTPDGEVHIRVFVMQ